MEDSSSRSWGGQEGKHSGGCYETERHEGRGTGEAPEVTDGAARAGFTGKQPVRSARPCAERGSSFSFPPARHGLPRRRENPQRGQVSGESGRL